MSSRNLALIAATCVSLIYGVTFTIAKDVMPSFIGAFGFILLRVAGSTVLFWLAWLFVPKERIAPRDFLRIAGAAFFGVALNMLTFFKGLSYTSPISAAVIMVTTPIIVLILSALILKERMEPKRAGGILLGLAGTAILILYGRSVGNAPNATLGNLLVFINAVSYGFYLLLVKKLMDRYNAFTFVKWVYLLGLLMVLPFGWSEFAMVEWHQAPFEVLWKIGFVVIFSTFLTYLLNLLSMKTLKPVTVAVFIYLQPLFATIFAIGLGKDSLGPIKIISAAMIFTGVYLVTQKKQPEAAGALPE
jgi:drug/metabolite transporter (DMT)-like permease